MVNHVNVPWGRLLTFPPVGFWQTGLPLAFVRKAWETMNYGGKRALEEYCVRRWPELGGLRAADATRLLRPRKSRLDEGLVLEQRAAEMLEDQGYFVARCFPYQPVIDLVAFDIRMNRDATAPVARLIQVKSGGSAPVRRQREQLRRLANSLGTHVSVELWRFPRNDSQPVIKILEGGGTP